MLKPLPRILPVLLLMALAGCSTLGGGLSSETAKPKQSNILDKVKVAPPRQQQVAAPKGNVLAQQQQTPVAAPQIQQRRAVLLLPLTGPNAKIGNQLLQASQMAVQDIAPAHFVVEPYDTAAGAAPALQTALQQHADIVIGPLLSTDVAAIKSIAASADVPVLALSNDQTQADKNVYLMGEWPGDQVGRVLSYAATQGVHNVIAIVPENAYGKTIADYTAGLNTTRLVDVIGYNPQSPDTQTILQRVIARTGQFEGILLPEGGVRGAQIANALRGSGVLQSVRLLGSSQWDNSSIDVNAFMGGWYAVADKESIASFMQRYQNTFGEVPAPVVSLAYDATALAALIASNNWSYDTNSLTQGQGYAGMGGIFRLQPGGVVQRGLSVHEITASGHRILSLAPDKFQ